MAMLAYNKYYTEQQRGNTHSFEGEREGDLDCRYMSRVRKRLRECGCMGGVLCVVPILPRIERTWKNITEWFSRTSVKLFCCFVNVSCPCRTLFQILKQLLGMMIRYD